MTKFIATIAIAMASAVAIADVSSNTVVEVVGVGASTNQVKKIKKAKRPAKITSASTYYDRKEGVAIFSGHVHVDDEEYQLHAEKAYVFMDGTNELKRIVALGNVAMTNETRRAYGGKAKYYRDSGLVILYARDDAPAEVREEKKDGDQVVKGSKIKFWVNSEQVEVINAEISAPTQGLGGLKEGLK